MTDPLENSQFCLDIAQKSDRERYLVCLFAAKKNQRHLWALLAFNQEVAKIRETVSESALGEIRLQWWQEVLGEIQNGSVREQPVIQELALLPSREMLWPLLSEIIEARRSEMFEGETLSFEGLTRYVDGVGGALCEAMLRLLAVGSELPDESVGRVRSVGRAWAMLGLIRALPYHWQAGRSLLPTDTETAMQMREAAKAYDALKPTIEKMLDYVKQELVSSSGSLLRIPDGARAPFYLHKIAKLHIEALAKAQNNPFELPLYDVSDFRKLRSVWWAKLIRQV